jgi:uncharacterized protein YggE
MSSPNNDLRNNDGNNNKKNIHLKFAFVVAILAIGILVAGLTTGRAINTALAQTDSKQGATTTSVESSDIVPPYHYPGNYQAPSTVSTTGTATAKVKPDKFSVTLGVETNGTTAQKAASANADLMAKVLAALKDLGTPESQIGTSNYNVYPVYDNGYPTKPCIDIYPPPPDCQPKQVITGYRASNSVTVTLDVSGDVDAGKLIDRSVNAGATNVNGVYFFVSQNMQEEIRDNLIKEAINNAKHRADIAAGALGLTVSGVQSISLNDVYFPYFSRSLDAAVPSAQGAPTQILSGEQEVSTSVSAVFYFSNSTMTSSGNITTPSGMTASQSNPNCINPPGGPMIC